MIVPTDEDMAVVDIENGFDRPRNDSHVPDNSTSFDMRVRCQAHYVRQMLDSKLRCY